MSLIGKVCNKVTHYTLLLAGWSDGFCQFLRKHFYIVLCNVLVLVLVHGILPTKKNALDANTVYWVCIRVFVCCPILFFYFSVYLFSFDVIYFLPFVVLLKSNGFSYTVTDSVTYIPKICVYMCCMNAFTLYTWNKCAEDQKTKACWNQHTAIEKRAHRRRRGKTIATTTKKKLTIVHKSFSMMKKLFYFMTVLEKEF